MECQRVRPDGKRPPRVRLLRLEWANAPNSNSAARPPNDSLRGTSRAAAFGGNPGPVAAGQAQHLSKGWFPPDFALQRLLVSHARRHRGPSADCGPFRKRAEQIFPPIPCLTDRSLPGKLLHWKLGLSWTPCGRKGLAVLALEAVARPGPAGVRRRDRTTRVQPAREGTQSGRSHSVHQGFLAIQASGSAAERLRPRRSRGLGELTPPKPAQPNPFARASARYYG
jgi:hypothetical protein